MNRRFWIAWAGALPVMVVSYLLYWARAQEPSPVESEYVRTGVVGLVSAIPLLIAAIQLPKLRYQDSIAWWLVPALLGLFVLIVGLAVGFMPDKPTDCAYLVRSHVFDPTCTTTSAVRTRVFIEIVAVWLSYGALAYVVTRVRRLRAQRAEQPSAPDRYPLA